LEAAGADPEEIKLAAMDFAMSRSSTTTSTVLPAAPWRALAVPIFTI